MQKSKDQDSIAVFRDILKRWESLAFFELLQFKDATDMNDAQIMFGNNNMQNGVRFTFCGAGKGRGKRRGERTIIFLLFVVMNGFLLQFVRCFPSANIAKRYLLRSNDCSEDVH